MFDAKPLLKIKKLMIYLPNRQHFDKVNVFEYGGHMKNTGALTHSSDVFVANHKYEVIYPICTK